MTTASFFPRRLAVSLEGSNSPAAHVPAGVPVLATSAAIRAPLWKRILPWAIAFAIACGWDRACWLLITIDQRPVFHWLEDIGTIGVLWSNLGKAFTGDLAALTDLGVGLAYAAIYVFGRIWPWIGLAMVFIFRDWAGTDAAKVRRGLRLGTFVFLVPAFAGIFAELLKIITGRLRPEAADGFYRFALAEGSPLHTAFWSTSGKGLASSHAAVAIGAALAAGLLLPRWRVFLWFMAIACCLSRVLVGAHFLSDIVAGIALGLLAYRLVYAWDARNNRGVPIDAATPTPTTTAPAAA